MSLFVLLLIRSWKILETSEYCVKLVYKVAYLMFGKKYKNLPWTFDTFETKGVFFRKKNIVL